MKRRISLKSLLTLVGLCAVLFAGYQAYRQHIREHVTIHVVDSVSGKPLAEFEYLLSISTKNQRGNSSRDLSTWITPKERNGDLYFKVPESCLVELTIESLKLGSGYLAQKREFLLTRDGGREFQFSATPALSVNGTITNKTTGKPIKDVVVLHYGYDGREGLQYATHQVETDANGKYTINCVSPKGKLTYSKAQLQDEMAIVGMKPPVNGLVNDLDIQMQSTPNLTGQVVDENGAPIAGARVRIPGDSDRPKRPATTTDEEGRFSIPAVRRELNELYIRSDHYKTASIWSDVPHEPLNVVLKKKIHFRVSARVLTPQGRGVSDFLLWTAPSVRKRIQDPQGRFDLEHTDSGPYCDFVVQAQGFPAVGKQIDFRQIALNSLNEAIAELSIKPHPGGQVHGNIAGGPEQWSGVAFLTPHDVESGDCWFVDNRRMDYEVDTDGILQHQTKITDGRYVFESVPPGFYVLHVDGPEMSPIDQLVQISEDTKQTLSDLRFIPSATITGQFFSGSHSDTKRSAYRKGFVRRGFNSPKIHFTADTYGKFRVEDVPVGPMKVWSQSQERGVHLQPGESTHITFDDPDAKHVVPIILHAASWMTDRTYRVTIRDEHDVRPVGDWANDQLRQAHRMDEDILISDIPVGKYHMSVSAMNGTWRHTTPINVEYPMSKIEVSLPTGMIEGTVTITSTGSNSGMRDLRLIRLDVASEFDPSTYVEFGTSRFRFHGLMPGKYQVVVGDHDLAPVRSEVFTISRNTAQWHGKASVTPTDQLGSLQVRITLEDFEKVPRKLIVDRDGFQVINDSTDGWHNQTEQFRHLAPGKYNVVAVDQDGNVLKKVETSIQTGARTVVEL